MRADQAVMCAGHVRFGSWIPLYLHLTNSGITDGVSEEGFIELW
jgi:hypothetical protein